VIWFQRRKLLAISIDEIFYEAYMQRKWEDEPSTGNHKGKQVMEVDFDHDLLQQTYTYIPR